MSFKTAVGGLSGSVLPADRRLPGRSSRGAIPSSATCSSSPSSAMIVLWLPEPDVKPAGNHGRTARTWQRAQVHHGGRVGRHPARPACGTSSSSPTSPTSLSCIKEAGLGDTGFAGIISSTQTLACRGGRHLLRCVSSRDAFAASTCRSRSRARPSASGSSRTSISVARLLRGRHRLRARLRHVQPRPHPADREGSAQGGGHVGALALGSGAESVPVLLRLRACVSSPVIMGVAATGQFAGWNVAWPLATGYGRRLWPLSSLATKARHPELDRRPARTGCCCRVGRQARRVIRTARFDRLANAYAAVRQAVVPLRRAQARRVLGDRRCRRPDAGPLARPPQSGKEMRWH